MRKYFLTGIVILLPFIISIFVFLWALEVLTTPFFHIVERILLSLHLNGNALFVQIISRLIALIFLIGGVICLGFLASKWIVSSIVSSVSSLFSKIPGLRIIFNFSKEVLGKVLSTKGPVFSGTALVPFPKEDSYALALFSEHIPEEVALKKPELNISVFIPTAPHPISGFVLLMKKEDIHPLNIGIDEVFKFQISCGILASQERESCQK